MQKVIFYFITETGEGINILDASINSITVSLLKTLILNKKWKNLSALRSKIQGYTDKLALVDSDRFICGRENDKLLILAQALFP